MPDAPAANPTESQPDATPPTADATPPDAVPAARPTPLQLAASPAAFNPRRREHWLVHIASPLGVSLIAHALLLAAFAGVTWVAARQAPEDLDMQFEARVLAEGEGGPDVGFQFPGMSLIDRAAKADADAAPMELDVNESLSEVLERAGSSAGANDATRDPGGGLELPALTRSDVIGLGGGDYGAGEGPGALGPRDPGGGGPIGALWGVGRGQRGRSVVYVVDRSGSFVDWVEAIDLEIKRSIGTLQSDQRFGIVFLRDNAPLAFKPKLIAADERGKREAFAWINLHPPSGGSDLTPAVRAAVKFNPEVLFLVTDYALFSSPVQATDMSVLRGVLKAARRGRPLTVHVILMGPFERPKAPIDEIRRRLANPLDLSPAQESLLREQLDVLETLRLVERIPAESGGGLQYLNGDALMQAWRKSHGRTADPADE